MTALEELVAHSQPRLRGYLFKMIANRTDLNDIEQDVWSDVFRYLPRLKDPDAFFPWIFRIARNRVFRVSRRKREFVNLDESAANISEARLPSDFTADDAADVYKALDLLNTELREVILLRFVEGMSYEQIAAVIGCPIGTVKSRLNTAKRAVRHILEREDRG